ncbi:unnamed protein product [Rotaria magnacalcarata]|uniref:Armadillo repeat-containing domain-containing protein n=4 Tax=Rotaria magnacalcarata TaxID=392030 RepID=A0A815G7B0_9BILA|nr:unnamed protein product [Rotaria magnacalcarata]CAF1563343.1 unnamed protein product [Rotaria magnacalcarata]CAF2091121.1 unnamed protein product [Rotaria magnacalcarata]CAF2156009.1 unnamed protein product [Rotaria magnacalcarata]CAF3775883.1 unnamed protein product [Rotaria magnacalcarata]
MPNWQKLYIGLGVSVGVCTGIGFYLIYRHQRQSALSKPSRPLTPTLLLSSLRPCHDDQYVHRISPSEIDNDDSEFIEFQHGRQIPDGSVPLTPDQASILTHFLCECNNDEEQLHYVLTSIANASTFKESQINLANAGCINHLRGMLLNADNEKTKCKIFLALHNLALNDFAITQFSSIVSIVINRCRLSPSNSLVRVNGLTLLINMSVLEYLHEEYMTNIYELGLLIESTIHYEDEALSSGKILVNLSTNKLNLENLLKITGVELKPIMNLFTSNIDQLSKSEDILLRFLSFYCNVADMIVNELKESEDSNNNSSSWLIDSTLQRQGALYFEFFDRDKQTLAKSLLRPQYTSIQINSQRKRLYQLMDKIRQYQLELSVVSN